MGSIQKESATLWVAVVLAVMVVGGLWYYSTTLEPQEQPREETPTAPVQTADDPAEDQGPLYPLDGAEGAETPELRPLPDLNDSDEYFKLELTELFGPALGPLLANSRLIERVVATADNLPRKHVSEQARLLPAAPGRFVPDATNNAGEFALNPDSYGRYDQLVHIFAAADMATMADFYRRFYPLFQKAYVDLGYPNGYFNDRLVEVIDHLQATPDASQPILLTRKHVLYEFADPNLEQMSSGQKLLLRMGPEHAATVKAKLAELRIMIVGQQS